MVEALLILALAEPPSFTIGQRNRQCKAGVRIAIETSAGKLLRSLSTTEIGGSESFFQDSEKPLPLLVVPSRRSFRPRFNETIAIRTHYMNRVGLPVNRGVDDNNIFTGRLQLAMKNKDKFDLVLGKILEPVPVWRIERDDSGMYFLQFSADEQSDHSSDGLGDGLISIFWLVDALLTPARVR